MDLKHNAALPFRMCNRPGVAKCGCGFAPHDVPKTGGPPRLGGLYRKMGLDGLDSRRV